MSVQTFPPDVSLYTGTYIDLICHPNITEAVDTGVNISFTWTAHDSNGQIIDIGGEGHTTTDQSANSTLRIEQLTIDYNMAVYNCLVSIIPNSKSAYINGNESSMDNITLNVIGKLHAIKSDQG